MKRLLYILPLLFLGLACNNGQQEQVMEQQRIQDSIEQARLDSIERIRLDSLEKVRQDSIEKAVINEKIAFLKTILNEFDRSYNPEQMKKHLSEDALKQLWRKDRIMDDEYSYDWAFFQDGGKDAEGSDGDYNPVSSRTITHVEGDWFKVRTTFKENMPYPTVFQVMVEDVDGNYLITKLK